MRVTYDQEADAVFVFLTPEIGFGEAKQSRLFDIPFEAGAVTASLDAEGRLLGIEILGASRVLTSAGLRMVRDAAEPWPDDDG